MKHKILIIADDIDSWTRLSTALKTHNYDPVWAAGCSPSARPDDRKRRPASSTLGLQGGDGVSVLERLRNNRRPSRENVNYSGIHRL